MSDQADHTHHTPPPMERHADVAIIGGSAAGLAAALQLGRQHRSVIVIDDARPRNAPAAHMHGYLGREGTPPGDLAAAGREEVRGHGGEVITGHATQVTRTGNDPFRVELTGGHTIIARRVLAATGVVDELPAIDGLAEHWGDGVVSCPFCHGYEVGDRRLVLIVTHPAGLHPAGLWRHLTARLTVVVEEGIDGDGLDALGAGGVDVRHGRATRIIAGRDGRVAAVELAGGERLDADTVAIGPRFHARADPLAPLGLQPAAHPSGLGDVVEVDGNGATAVPGLYAAGNVTDPSLQVLPAAAAGSRVGAMISFDLAGDDLAGAARPSANRTDWDHRYSGEQLWSGNPNGTLVHEVAGMPPGRALDVGAGEGGDALWLAEQGWKVTASDISDRALERVGAEADRRGLQVDCRQADANAPEAYEPAAYDLVSAHYPSIPRTPDGRGVANLLAAVVPGGTLLVVGHDLEPMRVPVDPLTGSRPFDPDAYVGTEHVAAVLTAAPGWEIEVHEKRPRPPGAASAHPVGDVVLRAVRRP
jgi:thioredoxin reductase/SAM-dependent methyltransferase